MRSVWNRLFNLTGFRGKTLWDFLGLLIVPVVIALAGWYLSEVSTQKQQQIEDDRVRQNVLQSYIRDMKELLLDRGLANSNLETEACESTTTPVRNSPVRLIAQASTLAAVRQLDGDRKGILLRFLFESSLIKGDPPIIRLLHADLSSAILSDASLCIANLSEADLSGATLHNSFLSGARFLDADLKRADLSDADLSGATLERANLERAILHGVFMSGANLSSANLADAINPSDK